MNSHISIIYNSTKLETAYLSMGELINRTEFSRMEGHSGKWRGPHANATAWVESVISLSKHKQHTWSAAKFQVGSFNEAYIF